MSFGLVVLIYDELPENMLIGNPFLGCLFELFSTIGGMDDCQLTTDLIDIFLLILLTQFNGN